MKHVQSRGVSDTSEYCIHSVYLQREGNVRGENGGKKEKGYYKGKEVKREVHPNF
jgi:hypothetical protein